VEAAAEAGVGRPVRSGDAPSQSAQVQKMRDKPCALWYEGREYSYEETKSGRQIDPSEHRNSARYLTNDGPVKLGVARIWQAA
jgi:hypothetical protein